MPHPISLQCGEDKKLSGADVVAAERQEGIPRATGASLALCKLLSLFLAFTNMREKYISSQNMVYIYSIIVCSFLSVLWSTI